MTITLYTRAGCHLCELARDALQRAAQGRTVTLTAIDIDSDPLLQSRYGECVPVARIGDTELAWPFTRDQARRLLDTATPA